ncbi:MAG: hypothetical protein IKV27_06365, partial [Lachnospiraceae bacterium]|nr:hypothetical protein [Lachnospiraceae bacterium]
TVVYMSNNSYISYIFSFLSHIWLSPYQTGKRQILSIFINCRKQLLKQYEVCPLQSMKIFVDFSNCYSIPLFLQTCKKKSLLKAFLVVFQVKIYGKNMWFCAMFGGLRDILGYSFSQK